MAKKILLKSAPKAKAITAPAKRARRSKASLLVLTVGHSTRPLQEFIDLLKAHEVGCVADVRTVPRSRHNPQFNRDIAHLIDLAQRRRIAVMCAEAVPWRCHRSLIADALLVRKIRCEDITSPTHRLVHKLTPFARVRGTRITYPAPPAGRPPKPAPGKRTPRDPAH